MKCLFLTPAYAPETGGSAGASPADTPATTEGAEAQADGDTSEAEKGGGESQTDGESNADEEDDDHGDQPKRRRPGRWQRQALRLEGELAAVRAHLAQQANGGAQQQRQEPSQTPPKEIAPPKPEDFANFEDFLVARAKHELKQELQREQQEARRQQSQQVQAQSQAEIASNWREQAEKAAEKYDDFHEVTGNPSLRITPVMADAIALSDVGTDVAYFLGKNPGEAKRISTLPPVRQIAEIGRIEAKLAAAPPAPAKRATKAPPPVKPVTGAAASSVDPEKMTTDEWMKWRQSQQSKR